MTNVSLYLESKLGVERDPGVGAGACRAGDKARDGRTRSIRDGGRRRPARPPAGIHAGRHRLQAELPDGHDATVFDFDNYYMGGVTEHLAQKGMPVSYATPAGQARRPGRSWTNELPHWCTAPCRSGRCR